MTGGSVNPSIPEYGSAPPPPPPFRPTRPGPSYGDQMLTDALSSAERRETRCWNMGPRIHGGDHPRDPGELPTSQKGPEILLEG